MKVEKLNEDQIRATLNGDDLLRRQIPMSEFAYGTEATRSLFIELVRFASIKLDFETDDSPIMVEAIPMDEDSIVLLVSKAPYPEELDTRFARFSDAPIYDYMDYDDEFDSIGDVVLDSKPNKATEIIDLVDSQEQDSPEGDSIRKEDIARLFLLDSIDEVLSAAHVLGHIYGVKNSLYHTKRGYELLVWMGEETTEDFNRFINILSEYGSFIKIFKGTKSYFSEHAKVLIEGNALQMLSDI